MVLVKICETIVEQDRGVQLRGEGKLEGTNLGVFVFTSEVFSSSVGEGPFGGVSFGERSIEGS